MATLNNNKKAMRKAVSAVLRALSPTEIHAQSQLVTRHVIASPSFQRSQTVSCYLSMPSEELDTSSLVSEIIRADGKMEFLRIHGEEDLRSLPSGTWGIKEPDYEWQGRRRLNAMEASSEPLDLILLPGVAFDHSLSRLGHGKGYYDRAITSYTSAHGGTKPLLVALALREQILEAGKVPTGEHDWKVDVIIGPDGMIEGAHEGAWVPSCR